MLDYNSLLLALAISALCLMATLSGTWLSRRADSFLLTLVIALGITVAAIISYSVYTAEARYLWLCISFVFLMAGFSTIYSASVQFRTGRSPWKLATGVTMLALVIGHPLLTSGYDGLAIIEMNLAAAVLLMGSGVQYWRARQEAPGPLIGMAALYAVSGLSFALCAAVLIVDRQWTIGHAPQNWAETLNIAVCIAGMTGIGALSLALHQWRLAAHHRREANTDSLTGLLNRRALFEQCGGRSMEAVAVVVFDIDRFKAINDLYGHAAGDAALRVFGDELTARAGPGETAARLGGEEFALILRDSSPGHAERAAAGIVRRFSRREMVLDGLNFQATVSAGIALGEAGEDFEAVLKRADEALYEAKRSGRNRAVISSFLHSVETRTGP